MWEGEGRGRSVHAAGVDAFHLHLWVATGGRQHSRPLWLLGTQRKDLNLMRPTGGLCHLLPSPSLYYSHLLFFHGHSKEGQN